MFSRFKNTCKGLTRPGVIKYEVVGGLSGLDGDLVKRIEAKIAQSLGESNGERKVIDQVFINYNYY